MNLPHHYLKGVSFESTADITCNVWTVLTGISASNLQKQTFWTFSNNEDFSDHLPCKYGVHSQCFKESVHLHHQGWCEMWYGQVLYLCLTLHCNCDDGDSLQNASHKCQIHVASCLKHHWNFQQYFQARHNTGMPVQSHAANIFAEAKLPPCIPRRHTGEVNSALAGGEW